MLYGLLYAVCYKQHLTVGALGDTKILRMLIKHISIMGSKKLSKLGSRQVHRPSGRFIGRPGALRRDHVDWDRFFIDLGLRLGSLLEPLGF